MTLILNVLHKDFSVIAGDKLLNASGPATLSMSGLTIKLPTGGKIHGAYPKVITSKGGSTAVGSAGVVAEHTYLEGVRSAEAPSEALRAVREAAYGAFNFHERDRLLASEGQMINESMVSFFDVEKKAFWTFILTYTRFESHQFAYARRQNATAQIFSIGSGNGTLHEKVPEEDFNAFVASIETEWTEEAIGVWLDQLFGVVGEHNDTVSVEYDAWIATRDVPKFRPLCRIIKSANPPP